MTKILLVEDDKDLREIYSVRLLAEGYTLVSSDNGEEALAAAVSEHPDLIISDVMMPKISGFEMLDLLKSNDATRDIPVIMLTALGSEKQRERGSKLGAEKYLVKSQIGIEDLVNAVHEVLGDSDDNPGLAGGSNAERLSQAVNSYNSSPNFGRRDNISTPNIDEAIDVSQVKQPEFTANASSVSFSGDRGSGSVVVSETKPTNKAEQTQNQGAKSGEPIIGNPSITSSNFAQPQSGVASVFSSATSDVTIKTGGSGESQMSGTVQGTATVAQAQAPQVSEVPTQVENRSSNSTNGDSAAIAQVTTTQATTSPAASQSPFNPPQATHPAEVVGVSQPQMPDRPMTVSTSMDQPSGTTSANVASQLDATAQRRDYGAQGGERIIVPPTHRDGRTPRINIDELLSDVS